MWHHLRRWTGSRPSAEDHRQEVSGPSADPQVSIRLAFGNPRLGASSQIQPTSDSVSPDFAITTLGVPLVGCAALGHGNIRTCFYQAWPVGQHQTGHLLPGLLRALLVASCAGEAPSLVPHQALSEEGVWGRMEADVCVRR